MTRTIKTKLDAAHEWVREFNAIDTEMIRKLMYYEPCAFEEVTLPKVGDRVFVFDAPQGRSDEGEIVAYNEKTGWYTIEPDSGRNFRVLEEDFEVFYPDTDLPMWGTMWRFDDCLDDEWLENYGGLRAMSDCGFRIYHSDEFGYFFGIDGAGYDFYDRHWLPLYEARGLKWHDEEDGKEQPAVVA